MPPRNSFFPVALFAGLVLAGCGIRLEGPPIEIGYRPSLVGAGNIVRLENRGGEPLRDLEVTIRTPKGEVGYEVAELAAREVLEVGWKKLGGFEVPDGAEVKVRAKGYLLAASAALVPSDEEGESDSP